MKKLILVLIVLLLVGCTSNEKISKKVQLEKELEDIQNELHIQKEENLKLNSSLERLEEKISELESELNDHTNCFKNVIESIDYIDAYRDIENSNLKIIEPIYNKDGSITVTTDYNVQRPSIRIRLNSDPTGNFTFMQNTHGDTLRVAYIGDENCANILGSYHIIRQDLRDDVYEYGHHICQSGEYVLVYLESYDLKHKDYFKKYIKMITLDDIELFDYVTLD